MPTLTAVSAKALSGKTHPKTSRVDKISATVSAVFEWSLTPMLRLECNYLAGEVFTVHPLHASSRRPYFRCMLAHRGLREPLMQILAVLNQYRGEV